MKKTVYYLSLLYLLTVGITNAFSLTEYLRPYVLVSALLILSGLVLFTVSGSICTDIFFAEDILLILALGIMSFNGILAARGSYLYLLAYSYVFLGSYISIKAILYDAVEFETLAKYLSVGAGISSVVGILEFFVRYNGVAWPDMYGVDTDFAQYGAYPRVIAFSSEPGIQAFFLETIGLFSIGYVWFISRLNEVSKIMYTFLISLCWLLTFSAGGIGSVTIGVTLIIIIYLLQSPKSTLRIVLTSVPIISSMYAAVYAFDPLIIRAIRKKISLDSVHRIQYWLEALKDISQNPIIGNGLGALSVTRGGSYVSWYLSLSSNSGLIVVAVILLFFLLKIIRVSKLSSYFSIFCALSIISGVIHLSLISMFFFPFVWTTIIASDIYYVRYRSSPPSYRLSTRGDHGWEV